MATAVERTKTKEVRGSGAAFGSDNCAPVHSGSVAEKDMDMDMVEFAAKRNPCAANLARERGEKAKVSENLRRSFVRKTTGTPRW